MREESGDRAHEASRVVQPRVVARAGLHHRLGGPGPGQERGVGLGERGPAARVRLPGEDQERRGAGGGYGARIRRVEGPLGREDRGRPLVGLSFLGAAQWARAGSSRRP
ncbi:hypothetical protein AB0J21_22025 [Streptomyces sp. NPDC049954]|uniref:hypothetical protein n=1 Tax=Streptomyces sp. NPDC049954 TaxID=3155779 RepID=UPI00342B8236